MAKNSSIQWTDCTYNPWHGCHKVSEGCKYCYMFRDKERYGQDPTTILRSKSTFRDPLNWQKRLGAGIPPPKNQKAVDFEPFPGMKIFTCSWSDFFIEDADEWRGDAWEIIRETPEFTYQILTKRPERVLQCLPPDWGEGWKNVWLGVSAENQRRADERISILAEIPAYTKFVSFEPLLGMVNLMNPTFCKPRPPALLEDVASGFFDLFQLPFDWAIIGGESGNETGKYGYRECKTEWIEFLLNQCKAGGAKVFVKQLGSHLAKELQMEERHGGDLENLPERLAFLNCREFPG